MNTWIKYLYKQNKLESKSENTQNRSQEEPPTNFGTDHQFATLYKVSESVSLYALTIVVVELAEYSSYYSTKVVGQNYIQQPPPYGSITGTPLAGDVDTYAYAEVESNRLQQA